MISKTPLSTLPFSTRTAVALVIVAALLFLHSSIAGAAHHFDATAKSLTAIRTGPNIEFSVVGRLESEQQLEVTARTRNFQWLMVEADDLSGWVAANALQVDGPYHQLPVTNQTLAGATRFPTVNTYNRLVGIRAYPDWNSPIQTTAWAGVDLLVVARGHYDWLYVASEFGYGWIPRSSVVATFDISTLSYWMPEDGESASLALLGIADDGQDGMVAGVPEAQIYRGDPLLNIVRPTGSVLTAKAAVFTGPGHQYNVIGELQQRDRPVLHAVDPTGQFVFVWTNTVDGWMLASNLQASVDISTLPVWNQPMRNAETSVTGHVAVAALNLRTGPSTADVALTSLSKGTQVTVIDQNAAGTWVKIATADGIGWSYAPLIQLDAAIQ